MTNLIEIDGIWVNPSHVVFIADLHPSTEPPELTNGQRGVSFISVVNGGTVFASVDAATVARKFRSAYQ